MGAVSHAETAAAVRSSRGRRVLRFLAPRLHEAWWPVRYVTSRCAAPTTHAAAAAGRAMHAAPAAPAAAAPAAIEDHSIEHLVVSNEYRSEFWVAQGSLRPSSIASSPPPPMPPTPPALLPEPMETLIAQELEEWVAAFDGGSGGTGVAGGQVDEHEGGNGADRRGVTAEASVGRQYKHRRLNDKPSGALAAAATATSAAAAAAVAAAVAAATAATTAAAIAAAAVVTTAVGPVAAPAKPLPGALQWSAAATSLASSLAAMRCSAESRLLAPAQPVYSALAAPCTSTPATAAHPTSATLAAAAAASHAAARTDIAAWPSCPAAQLVATAYPAMPATTDASPAAASPAALFSLPQEGAYSPSAAAFSPQPWPGGAGGYPRSLEAPLEHAAATKPAAAQLSAARLATTEPAAGVGHRAAKAPRRSALLTGEARRQERLRLQQPLAARAAVAAAAAAAAAGTAAAAACTAAAPATAVAETTNAEAATADSTGGLPTTLLPDGWACRVGQAPSGQTYKRYFGPNGERAQSLKQVMAAVAVAVAAKGGGRAIAAAGKAAGSAVGVAVEEEDKETGETEEMKEMEEAELEAGESGKHTTHTCGRPRELTDALCKGAQAVNRYTYQDYATSTFSCLGFDEGEEYAFFERRGDGRRERVPVTQKTAANLAGYLSSYFGKLKKKPCRVPRLHRLPPCLQASAEVAISNSISASSSATEVEPVVTEAVEEARGSDEGGGGGEGGGGETGQVVAAVVAEGVETREGDRLEEEVRVVAEHEETTPGAGGCSLFEYTYQEQQVSAFTFLGFNESESYAFYERKADGRQEGSPRPLA